MLTAGSKIEAKSSVTLQNFRVLKREAQVRVWGIVGPCPAEITGLCRLGLFVYGTRPWSSRQHASECSRAFRPSAAFGLSGPLKGGVTGQWWGPNAGCRCEDFVHAGLLSIHLRPAFSNRGRTGAAAMDAAAG